MNNFQKKILKKNLHYLLSNLTYGERGNFAKTLGVNASTVTRWKKGSHLPDSYSLGLICSYFGIDDYKILITIDLYSDTQYVPPQILKQHCINVIRHMNHEEIKALHNYLKKSRNQNPNNRPVQQYLNSLCNKPIDYYELLSRIMVRFDMNKENAQKELIFWINNSKLEG